MEGRVLTFDETKDELNITLGDSADVTFTPEEKIRALTKAWNDSYVVKTVMDSTLTFDTSTAVYARPTSLDSVKDIYVSRSNSTSDEPEKISSHLWEAEDTNIRFKNGANNIIPDGYTLYVKGNKKYTVSDTLPTASLEEYVIALAGYHTLTALTFKKANLFLKNDTSMGELITLRRELEREVNRLRGQLVREFESA